MEQTIASSIVGSESRSTVSAGTQTLSNDGVTVASTNPSSYTGTPNTAEAKSIDTAEKSKTDAKPKKSKNEKVYALKESSESSQCDDSIGEDSSGSEDSGDLDATDSSSSECESVTSRIRESRAKKLERNRAQTRKSKSGAVVADKEYRSDTNINCHCSNGNRSLQIDRSSRPPTCKSDKEDKAPTEMAEIANVRSKCKTKSKPKSKLNTVAERDDCSKESSDESESEITSKRAKRLTKPPSNTNSAGKCSCEKSNRRSFEPKVGAVFDQKTAPKFQWKSLHHRGVKLSKKVVERARELRESKSGPPEPQCKETTTPMASAKAGNRMEFVRLDHRWENHTWVTRPTGQDMEAEDYDDFAFKVKRELDSDGKYQQSSVEIANKALQKALIKVLGKVKSVSLVGDRPSIDPDILFMFSAELSAYRKDLKMKMRCAKKSSHVKKMRAQVKVLKLLFEYINKDYGDQKKKLGPMLKSGSIRFPLLWALFKPNTIIYAPTYQADQVPRAFRVEYVFKMKSILKGDLYIIEGQYNDYDGKKFGQASIEVVIGYFQGPRKITSLPCYPLEYHKDYQAIRQTLIKRGQTFAELKGMQFRHHQGMAFYKKTRQVERLNLNGRIMVDPENFRRINPNYTVSSVKNEDPDLLSESESEGEHSCESSNSEGNDSSTDRAPRPRRKIIRENDQKKSLAVVEVDVEDQGNEIKNRGEDEFDEANFTEEDYIIASPVVLGFSFAQKRWVEFDVAGIRDIKFNENAFDSLVLPDDQKQVVRALVESRSNDDSRNIADVIQGKGEGLVTVLHGPPGCGKTLTAEGIAELLKKPLYTVSVGELGARVDHLERKFTEIIDIAHSWSAILLLDEADIFLEQRQPTDLSRNALVSVFLRLLEYFQGIVFLTTNRVVHFDGAFRSRIHIGLRYGGLELKAKKEVWRLFLDKVRRLSSDTPDPSTTSSSSPAENAIPDVGSRNDHQTSSSLSTPRSMATLTDDDISRLASYDLNGREIKNCVRTALSLANVAGEGLAMKHLEQVLKVGQTFADDLHGGLGGEIWKIYT